MEIKRRKLQGVLNILSFNRHFYVIGLLVLAALIASYFLFDWPAVIFWVIVIAFLYGFIMPLLVSAYVYDLSGYYNFHWLKEQVGKDEKVSQLVNINAGFDETSFIIENKLPGSDLKVFDFYNAKQHTEPAIKRARKVSLVYPDTQQIATGHIPLKDKKVQFLKECHRLCKPGGKVIMVEHLRDFPNFLAFTVGFTHFFSRATWKKAFERAGFSSFRETKFTPFMSIFNCRP